MNTFITILKIASAILFIMLLVPAGKIFIPMYLILLVGIVYPYSIGIVVLSALALCALILLIVLSFRNRKKYDTISRLILLALYIHVAGAITSVLASDSAACLRSYLIFISVSLIAIIFVCIRIFQNQYPVRNSVAIPFRKWISRALMDGDLPRD